MLIKHASRGYFPRDTYGWNIKTYLWVGEWCVEMYQLRNWMRKHITNLIAVNVVLIFLEFVYRYEWYTGFIKGAMVT